ncbi:MAG: c-type cytochrome [Verrucomicrobiales bacterium]|nr:c-type cytochrome [Verrucomicrobiales bacterium]
MLKRLKFALLATSLAILALAQEGDEPGEAQPALPPNLKIPPAPALSPEEALKTFRLPPGFRIELVASEPLLESPVALQFDPTGRIWVVEMRGYMRNIGGIGEDQPFGRVVVLEDTNDDGRMDKSRIFLDHLVMPRALCLIRDGLLVAEPPKLWFCRDTNGDGRADKKIEVANDYAVSNDPKLGKNSNPEHASNGLMLALDNWIYSPDHAYRYRNEAGRWLRGPTLGSRGQWGISQDDFGRLFYNSNSDQLRGDLVPDEYVRRNTNYHAAGSNVQIASDQSVWPIRVTPGVNRGYQKDFLRDGKLVEFTAACGPVIYRGDNFPAEFRGNAFVAEPAANLVRRNILIETNAIVSAANAYEKAEFLTSTDERFRPVNLSNGPDGALYIVDMYRGIIQHRLYITTFLRRQIEQRGLDQPVDQGRIYRVIHQGAKRRTKPRLIGASTTELVGLLSHPNGWWRDTAQRLLVERAEESSLPKLRKLALAGADSLGRLHALWTLQGLNKLDEATARMALEDKHPKVRAAAIRLYEPYARAQSDAAARVRALLQDASPDVRLQLALTLGELRDDAGLAAIATANAAHRYIRDAVISGLGGRELEFLERLLAEKDWHEKAEGREPFLRALAKSVFTERKTERINRLLELAAQKHESFLWQQTALLDGLLDIFPPPPKDKPNQKPKAMRLDAEPPALANLRRIDQPETRSRVEKLAALITWPGKPDLEAAIIQPLSPEQQKRFEAGQELYAVTCGACHQMDGTGQEGLAPPLLESDWTTGSEDRLIRIALNGVRGPIAVKGRTYELEMPNMGVLDDEQLASILTYVRRAWGHSASPIEPSTIAKVRKETETRDEAWTELELQRIP